VGRVQAALPPNVNITVVPDGALHRLPFAALRDRRAGGYLIESHAVTVVPSATLLARQLRHARPLRPPVTVFAVTDPVPTAGLPALPGSAREGQSIARLYAAAEVVSRERATKATFLLAAPKADVIHFAGHAVANPRYPLMAHLQFSAESGVSLAPTLDATEISGMRLERTMLVVLAACTTGGGQVRRGEGVLSLARPFLIAGAPAVVATLWDIDDAASAVFLSHFHEQFVHTRDAAVALREAQRRAAPLMRPSHWAAFIVVGQSSGGGSRRTSDDE
jgi:CHAT domain-containing protein